MLTSGKTYDIIRESGFVSLPSRRTLRDYTNWIKLKSGFNAEVLNFIAREFKVHTLVCDSNKIISDITVILKQVCHLGIR